MVKEESREMTKKELRQLMRERQASFMGDTCKEAESIWAQVEADPSFQNAGTILVYMSVPGEVPTEAFIDKWAESKTIVIPKVEGDDLGLYIYNRSKLVEGYKGILEPSNNATSIPAEDIDYAIIPGVAFSGTTRLGHGKGFYDRTLKKLRCPKVGVCLSYRVVEDIPTDEWDQTVTKLITAR